MSNVEIKGLEWKKIHSFLASRSDVYVGKPSKCKRFMEGVLWVCRSGGQWRLLPKRYGKWNSVFKRYSRWAGKGIWQGMMDNPSQGG